MPVIDKLWAVKASELISTLIVYCTVAPAFTVSLRATPPEAAPSIIDLRETVAIVLLSTLVISKKTLLRSTGALLGPVVVIVGDGLMEALSERFAEPVFFR
jgi:hypothetical protein